MLRRSAYAATLLAVIRLHFGVVALAQEPTRLGAEFQINTVTVSDQHTWKGAVDLETNGDFVVAWFSEDQDGLSYGVFAQRYASSGARIGVEFQVNTYTSGNQKFSAVGSDADGDFVIAWQSYEQDGSHYGAFARRFASSGAALAAEFRVNVFTANGQSRPVVARDADGDFVVAWQSNGQDGSSYGVFARRFNAAGTALASELQVNTFTTGGQRAPAIDLDQDGDFVVTWQSALQDGSGEGVFGQRFNSLGVRQGPEFAINSYLSGNQQFPVVGVDVDGDFIVAWSSVGQDGDLDGIFARGFDSTGAPRGSEMQVNLYATGGQSHPSLGIDQDGSFVVAWHAGDGDALGIFARHFRSLTVPTSGDIRVNTFTENLQSYPAVRSDADGDFVVAWSSFTQDGDGEGVFGQRFDVPALLDIDGNGQLTALTDGLLVLRFLFGFTGSPLTSAAVGPNCTRCDSATILPYLQGLT